MQRGEVALPSLTSEELVAAGARSPVPGLLVSERLAAMGVAPLTAALGAALRSLVARGLLDAAAVGHEAGELGAHLGAELELVVTLTRAPDFVALVSAPRPAALAGLCLTSAKRAECVLHGFLGPGGPLVLEERVNALGIHDFALRTLGAEAGSLEAWLSRESAGRVARGRAGGGAIAVELELFLARPRRGWSARGAPRRRWSLVVDPDSHSASLVSAEHGVHHLPPPAPGAALADALGAALADALGPAARRGA